MQAETGGASDDDDGSTCTGWGSDISLSSEDLFLDATSEAGNQSSLDWEKKHLHTQLKILIRTVEAQTVEHEALRQKVSLLETSQNYLEPILALIEVSKCMGVVLAQVVLPYVLLTATWRSPFRVQTLQYLFERPTTGADLVFLVLRLLFLQSGKAHIGSERDFAIVSMLVLSVIPPGPCLEVIAFAILTIGVEMGVRSLCRIAYSEPSVERKRETWYSVRTAASVVVRGVDLCNSCKERMLQHLFATEWLLLLPYLIWRLHAHGGPILFSTAAILVAQVRTRCSEKESPKRRSVQDGLRFVLFLAIDQSVSLKRPLLSALIVAVVIHELAPRLPSWMSQLDAWRQRSTLQRLHLSPRKETTHNAQPNLVDRAKKDQ